VFCWGDNSFSQVTGQGDLHVHEPLKVSHPGAFTAVSAGAGHTCAIDDMQRVLCWGANSSGQAGQAPSFDKVASPSFLSMALVASDVSAGASHTCALSSNQVFCWGDNKRGQSCLDPAMAGETEVPAPCDTGMFPAIQVDSGGLGSCALDASDAVLCWGDATMTGEPNSVAPDIFVPVPVFDDAQKIAVGEDHACALTHGGQIFCWGSNDAGQVDGVPAQRVVSPTLVLGPP
jgi:alpha-tubulin suppressor-like RCC1 family protein